MFLSIFRVKNAESVEESPEASAPTTIGFRFIPKGDDSSTGIDIRGKREMATRDKRMYTL